MPADLPDPVVTAPGAVPPPNNAFEQRVRALEARFDELSRRDLSNGQVGQGGRIRGLYKDGTEMFAFGTDPADGVNKVKVNYTTGDPALRITPGSPLYGGVEQLVLFDLAKHRVIATDDLAGYGIVEPAMSVPMVSIPGLNMVAGVEQQVAVAKGFFYQAAWASELICSNFVTMTAVSCRLRITDNVGNTFFSSATTAGTNGVQHSRYISVPSDFINKQNVEIAWMATSTGSGTMVVAGVRSHGISRSKFNLGTAFQ